jgi:hypothetical protein
MLARAASGALSSCLVYAVHHGPRRVTLTRRSLAETIIGGPSLRGLVTELSAGVARHVDSGCLQTR